RSRTSCARMRVTVRCPRTRSGPPNRCCFRRSGRCVPGSHRGYGPVRGWLLHTYRGWARGRAMVAMPRDSARRRNGDVPEQHPHEPDPVAGAPNGATAFDALAPAEAAGTARLDAVDGAGAIDGAGVDGRVAEGVSAIDAFGERDIWDARV